MLRFKGILYVHFSLVDHGSWLRFFSHSFSSGGKNIKTDNITWGEFPILYSLFWSFFINDYFISINQMLFKLMGKNTLNWFNSIFCANFSNICSNILVRRSNFDTSSSSKERIVSSKNNICFFTFSFTSNYNSMSTLSSISINVSS